jgi:hypothetical protein
VFYLLAESFVAYLEKHRQRIINYYYFQTEEICSYAFGGAKLYGSGAIESTIKQIDRRTKISWHSGKLKMLLKYLPIAVLILTD